MDWTHTYYNDTQVLSHHYANADAYLHELLQYVNTNASAGNGTGTGNTAARVAGGVGGVGGGSSLLDLSYPGTRYGDWVAAAVPFAGAPLQARHTSNLISGFFWLKQLRIMQSAAETLGKVGDAAAWSALADKGAASYNALYFSEAEGLYHDVDCPATATAAPASGAVGAPPCHSNSKDGVMSVQTAQSLPLFLGLPATPAATKRVGDALATDVLEGAYPGRTTTGLVGTKYASRAVQFHPHGGSIRFRLAPRTHAPRGCIVRVVPDRQTKARKIPTRNILPLLSMRRYVLPALVATGHADVALTVATAMEYPSWGRMLPASVHPLGQGEGTTTGSS